MNIKNLLIAAAVAATLLTTAIAKADDGPSPEQRMQRAFVQLGLSDAQRSQLRGVSETHRAATEPLRDQVRTAQQTLANAKPDDPNYAAVTAEARANLDAARAQLRDQQEQLRSQMQAVLTPEQRNALEARRAERRERMEERRGQMGEMDGRDGMGERRGPREGGRLRRQ
ncbi:MAG: Spy/CpxP family protein refolding chaperone [Gammaproteobacteria bacterium]